MDERVKLDRRLELAYFKYAALRVVSWYPNVATTPLIFGSNLNDFLVEFTPHYHKAFHHKYSG